MSNDHPEEFQPFLLVVSQVGEILQFTQTIPDAMDQIKWSLPWMVIHPRVVIYPLLYKLKLANFNHRVSPTAKQFHL